MRIGTGKWRAQLGNSRGKRGPLRFPESKGDMQIKGVGGPMQFAGHSRPAQSDHSHLFKYPCFRFEMYLKEHTKFSTPSEASSKTRTGQLFLWHVGNADQPWQPDWEKRGQDCLGWEWRVKGKPVQQVPTLASLSNLGCQELNTF